MKEGLPSLTAHRVAALRALHQELEHPAIFHDPLAARIIGAEALDELRATPDEYDSPPMRSLRASVAARSRFAEEILGVAAEEGVRQYVVLGAGFDSFAYRNPWAEAGMLVFEVDHPATQEWKRAALEKAGIPVPPSVAYVAADFERETLTQALDRAHFDANRPSFFSWLGVTVYLAPERVMDTLRRVLSAMVPGSGIVFDYVISPEAMTPSQRAGYEALSVRVAALGEPWLSAFNPSVFAEDLRALGFKSVEDRGAEELNARYFADRSDGFRLSGVGRLVHARL